MTVICKYQHFYGTVLGAKGIGQLGENQKKNGYSKK